MREATPELILGTAKLGLPDYGIHGASKSPVDPRTLLTQAFERGVTKIDTAPRYGNAEQLIGDFHQTTQERFRVTSKAEGLSPGSKQSPQKLYESVMRSLDILGVECLDTLYLHQNEFKIISDAYVHEGLNALKEKKMVQKVGVSVYANEECSYAASSTIYDTVQLPVSILDSVMYEGFAKTQQSGVEFVARSVFLQGIVFRRDKILGNIRDGEAVVSYLHELDAICERYGMNIGDVAIAYVRHCQALSGFIIGASSVEQIVSALDATQCAMPSEMYREIFELSARPRAWTNPRNW